MIDKINRVRSSSPTKQTANQRNITNKQTTKTATGTEQLIRNIIVKLQQTEQQLQPAMVQKCIIMETLTNQLSSKSLTEAKFNQLYQQLEQQMQQDPHTQRLIQQAIEQYGNK